MKRVIGYALALMLVAPPASARELDPLETTLWQLRRFVAVADPAAAERQIALGEGLMRFGWSATSMMADLDSSDDEVDNVVALVALAGVAMVAAGLVTYLVGASKTVEWPRGRAKEPAEYMKARRLARFMKLPFDEQYAIASRDPDFAAFLTKLSGAYALCAQYGLIEDPPLVPVHAPAAEPVVPQSAG